MELTWINKLRIAAVAGLGVAVIGLLAWPLAAPADPLLPVRAWSVSVSGTIALLILAFGVGFAGYFIAWPHGREIAILGVPFGLTIWAGRSGPMRVLTQALPMPPEREALALALRFEPLYWLLIAAAGFAGVLCAQYLRPASARPPGGPPTRSPTSVNTYIYHALALVVAVVTSHFFVGAFVQNIATSRNAVAQPAVGQIIFGVVTAFGVAAFLVKKFLDVGYVWPALASAFVLGFAQAIYHSPEALRQFAETRPATSFPHSVLAVLPIQLVALGTLGSVAGYWLAVRYDWWRKHESAS
jgi:hypothetical protein